MGNYKLIEEILSFSEPERFKALDVSPIVLRYMPIGSERSAVISKLETQGFKVVDMNLNLEKCPDCDNPGLQASYINQPKFKFLPDISYITIGIGFKNEKVAFISAFHTKNVY